MEQIHAVADEPDGRAQSEGANGVHQIAAEKQSEAEGGQGAGKNLDRQRIDRLGCNGFQPLFDLLKGGPFLHNVKRQVIEPVDPVQIGGAAVDPLGFGERFASGRIDGDDDGGGDGENIHLFDPIGRHNPLDGIFHPVDLRSALQKGNSHLGRDVQKLLMIDVLIHRLLPPKNRV